MATPSNGAARKRLGLRFSLRMLLAMVTLGGVGLGFWKAYIEPYRAQAQAIRVFKEAGGAVTTRPAGPLWFCKIAGDERMQSVIKVDLANCPVNDDCLAWMTRLPDLEDFQIGHSTYGVPLPTVERSLENIEYLNLVETPVTDEGLRHLARCRKLKTLFLSRTRVTDAGLKHLENLHELRVVWLLETQVTAEGARTLRSALPKAFVGI